MTLAVKKEKENREGWEGIFLARLCEEERERERALDQGEKEEEEGGGKRVSAATLVASWLQNPLVEGRKEEKGSKN